MSRTLLTALAAITLFIILAIIFFSLNVANYNGPGQESGSAQVAPAQESDQSESRDYGLTDFSTQDIYGGSYTEDIFKDYSMTLVNVWGTYCGPCLDEMPDLGELYEEYASKNVNIVGIVIDTQDEYLQPIDSQLDLAKEIAEETGADYSHLLISEEMFDVLSGFNSIPTSFFVDSDGNIISEFYIGSKTKEEWKDVIETNLEKL